MLKNLLSRTKKRKINLILYCIEKVEQKFKKFFKNIFYFKNFIFTENSKYIILWIEIFNFKKLFL